jgi:glucose-1-phosphate thymidylyltransferase
VPDPHRFGIATLDDLTAMWCSSSRSPTNRRPTSRSWGVPVRPDHPRGGAAIEPSARGELEITDAIQWLIDAGHRVRCELLTGWWIDTGKLTPLLEANRLLLEKLERAVDGSVDESSVLDGRVVVAEGAEIVNSTIRGPVAIGPAPAWSTASSARSRPSADRCEVINSEIEHSVVMDDSR